MGSSLGRLCSIPRERNPLSDSTTMAGPRTSEPNGEPHAVNPDPELEQISETLWEFFTPPGKIDADIIFFHGLSEGDSEKAYWTTWLSRDQKVIWPKEWLKRKCPNARMLSVSYNSSAVKREGEHTPEPYTLGENLVNDIKGSADADCGQDRPVILVGHCLGGIVIKQFITSAFRMRDLRSSEEQFQRRNNFLNNVKGVFFFATPHQGSSEIENLAKHLKYPSPILDLLKVLSTSTQRINEEFRQHRHNLKARSYAVLETLETHTLGFKGMVVQEASARLDIDTCHTLDNTDHFSVCKARNARDFVVIGQLAQFTNEILKAEIAEQEAELEKRLEKLKRPFQNSNGSKAMAIRSTG